VAKGITEEEVSEFGVERADCLAFGDALDPACGLPEEDRYLKYGIVFQTPTQPDLTAKNQVVGRGRTFKNAAPSPVLG
jgi:hypothetical protein